MAGKSTISITFKLDGDNKGLKDLIKDADGLKAALQQTVSQAQQLDTKAINFAAIATGVNAARDSLVAFQTAMQNFTAGYAETIEHETKLATVMRQRMNASDEEIDSIKRMALAQRELGVVDDLVTVAGMQQLGTFVTTKDSLEALMPAMNNLIAQQKGVNATTQDAVNVGNLMGKVMQGQTSALTRVGITFSEAEEQVLKFGTEEDKAAMLAQVITNNVGNMNVELGKTDIGKQQQMKYMFDDIQDALAELVYGAQPILTMAAQMGMALSGVVQLTTGLKAMNAALHLGALRTKLVAVSTKMLVRGTAITRVFGAAMQGAAYKAVALKLALKGLMIATGVGAAIVAVTSIIEHLAQSSEDAADKQGDLGDKVKTTGEIMSDVSKQASQSAAKEVIALEQLKDIVTDETKSKEQRNEAIRQTESLYPGYIGKLNTESMTVSQLSDVYDDLKDSIIAAAEAKALQTKIEEGTAELLDIELEKNRKIAQQAEQKKEAIKALAEVEKERAKANDLSFWARAGAVSEGMAMPSDNATAEARQRVNKANKDIKQTEEDIVELGKKELRANQDLAFLKDKLAEKNEKAAKTAKTPGVSVKGVGGHNTAVSAEVLESYNEEATTLREIQGNITYLRGLLQECDKEQAAAINARIERWQKEEKAILDAGKAVEELKTEAEETGPTLIKDPTTLQELTNNISILNDQLQTASLQEAAAINQTITAYEEKADAIRNAGKASEKESATMTENLLSTWNATKQVSGSIDGISSALQGNGTAWQQVQAVVDGVIGLYQGFTAIVQLVNLMTGASIGHAAAKGAEGVAETGAATAMTSAAVANTTAAGVQIVANKAATASFKQLAAAQYLAAHASIPFAGFAIGAGFIASMEALVATAGLPMLAKGGIASGPTLAMVGEYSGAANNPEVIAPLDKLQKIIGKNDEGVSGTVEFKIEGRQLVGILNKENNRRRRS